MYPGTKQNDRFYQSLGLYLYNPVPAVAIVETVPCANYRRYEAMWDYWRGSIFHDADPRLRSANGVAIYWESTPNMLVALGKLSVPLPFGWWPASPL